MTRLLGFDPLQRATEFICRLMQCDACVGAQRPGYRWRLGLVCVGAQRPDVLEAGACVRRCPEARLSLEAGLTYIGASKPPRHAARLVRIDGMPPSGARPHFGIYKYIYIYTSSSSRFSRMDFNRLIRPIDKKIHTDLGANQKTQGAEWK